MDEDDDNDDEHVLVYTYLRLTCGLLFSWIGLSHVGHVELPESRYLMMQDLQTEREKEKREWVHPSFIWFGFGALVQVVNAYKRESERDSACRMFFIVSIEL